MEYKRPRGGLFAEQRRQNGETFGQKLRSFFTIRRAGGLVVRSAEGVRFAYSDTYIPGFQASEQTIEQPADEMTVEVTIEEVVPLAINDVTDKE